MIRKHVFFSGKVQGVFFRANTKDKAQELGLYGWVKNLPDGRVEAVIEGEKEKADELIEWCKNKQPYARVDDVDIKEEEPSEQFNHFFIER